MGRTAKLNAWNFRGGIGEAVGQITKLIGKHWLRDKSFNCFHEADDGREIFGAGAAFVFMAATEKNGMGQKRRANVERPGAFGTVEFVTANCDEVGFKLVDCVEGLFAERLDGVGVK